MRITIRYELNQIEKAFELANKTGIAKLVLDEEPFNDTWYEDDGEW